MSFFLNLRIARKLVAGFAVLVALVGGVSAFTVARVSFLDQSAEWTTHTYGVLGGLDDALLGIVNQETGLRGFLVAGKEEFLAQYKNGLEQYNSALDRKSEVKGKGVSVRLTLGGGVIIKKK